MNSPSLNLSSKLFTFLVPRLSKAMSKSPQKPETKCKPKQTQWKFTHHPMAQISQISFLFLYLAETIPRLNKYKNQLYGLEWHLARDITVLEKLKLPYPPPCCLDTTVINSHYIHYKTIEIQDHLNPSQHCQGALTPLPAAVLSVITLTNAMGHRVTNSEDATGLSSSSQLWFYLGSFAAPAEQLPKQTRAHTAEHSPVTAAL